ncbi:hypothetical protein C8Q70DRAFT_156284 [Cubamyces menziesii]|nr:hypothetical protein C8Q70DRAFT_156284 [Cubamyces menziesii]
MGFLLAVSRHPTLVLSHPIFNPPSQFASISPFFLRVLRLSPSTVIPDGTPSIPPTNSFTVRPPRLLLKPVVMVPMRPAPSCPRSSSQTRAYGSSSSPFRSPADGGGLKPSHDRRPLPAAHIRSVQLHHLCAAPTSASLYVPAAHALSRATRRFAASLDSCPRRSRPLHPSFNLHPGPSVRASRPHLTSPKQFFFGSSAPAAHCAHCSGVHRDAPLPPGSEMGSLTRRRPRICAVLFSPCPRPPTAR